MCPTQPVINYIKEKHFELSRGKILALRTEEDNVNIYQTIDKLPVSAPKKYPKILGATFDPIESWKKLEKRGKDELNMALT